MATKRAHVLISGRVQGVWFRGYTQEQAVELDVNGWVRNLRDGRVEAVFEGDENAVQQMVNWCHVGPPSARVTKVEVTWEAPAGESKGFRIAH
ncbi:MAG: acylphosphatase [Planctomycetes bacterium]|nr:acylphosphatase [Planctomycetota bacterium]